jgi:hypothetical protein
MAVGAMGAVHSLPLMAHTCIGGCQLPHGAAQPQVCFFEASDPEALCAFKHVQPWWRGTHLDM